jgi:hypothetical protein
MGWATGPVTVVTQPIDPLVARGCMRAALGEADMPSLQSSQLGGRHAALCLASLAVASGLSGCVLGGPRHDPAPVEAFSTNAFRVTRPNLVSSSEGLQVSGAVCRRRQDVVQRQAIRIEHFGASGRFLDATSVKLGRLDDHPIHCVFYQAQTSWKLDAGDTVRVCLDQAAAGGATSAICAAAS